MINRVQEGRRRVNCCSCRFYGELNDFLPPNKKQATFRHLFHGAPAVKDIIEALGVPHTEVGLILINGEPAGFSRKIKDGDRLSVYPFFTSIDISPISGLQPFPPERTRFVLDTHLGKLAVYLRMLGFDALYKNDFSDGDLAEISAREGRILLTRDRGLLKRSAVVYGYLVRSGDPEGQLLEVMRRFALLPLVRPFKRCLRCNHVLEDVGKEEVAERLPPKVREHFHDFRLCRRCGRVYWKGSHYENMVKFLRRIMAT
ncbi:Mut7-C RNAse domain-containing protein [Desulfovirgula thermocuniculi]|uniref:Mut7-C RNAse domain-containing protein n=1 Tax=Desulfovirgula thermocuniculi TaxID=348842 RepID=UPI000687BB16|nr:Mut7-C RNAse domain-containing protein [Desulfovirgula thermocuniculi]